MKFTKHYSLFWRKKDRCNTCVGYDEGNVDANLFEAHQKRKDNGFELKEKDKQLTDGVSRFVITADTESLLTAPCNSANVMFFHSKLNLHNFTFYDLQSKKVMNY